MQRGLVLNIQKYSIQDGPGIRTTVFLKGCPLRCWWCHNPESQSAEPEVRVQDSRCVRCGQCLDACPQTAQGNGRPQPAGGQCTRCGACADACPTGARQLVGRSMTTGQVLREVLQDRIFYDDSGGGVTLSGGEPLMQPAFAGALLEACRQEGIHTALDTCGFAAEEDLLAMAPLVDLFLYDLKVVDDGLHRQFTSVSNAPILNNLKALGRAGGNIWIRMPIVPEFNDTDEHVAAAARLAASVPGVRQVNLLPFHPLGLDKLPGGAPADRVKMEPPSGEYLNEVADKFRAFGLHTLTSG